jgi:hypothetical protein
MFFVIVGAPTLQLILKFFDDHIRIAVDANLARDAHRFNGDFARGHFGVLD